MLALVLSSLSAYQIQVDHQLEERDVQVIAEGLSEFNRPFFGQQKGADFAVYLKDDTGKVVGGVIAWTLPGIGLLCIDTLWIPEHLRNKGFGTQLMLAAEAEGKRRGCTHAQLETLPFQGEPFYQKLGYVRIGVVKKMYGEHDAIYMRKSFDTLLVIDRK
jgi:GNAT superfamily N-acetyltransferase